MEDEKQLNTVDEIADKLTELEGGPCPKSETEDDKLEKMSSDEENEKEGSSNKVEMKEEETKESECNEEDDSEMKESDDEKEMGLLDRPVEVTGCRARRQVERLEYSFALPNKDKQIPEGRGQKLGDCPRIEFQIAKHSVADLKALHRVLFNRQGTANDTKKNIRKFSGFPFQEDSSEFEQKKAKTEKFSIPVLKGMCEVLDIERSGTKDDIVMRLLQFLVCPKDSGKALPKKKSSSRDKKNTTKKRGKGDVKKLKAKILEEGAEEVALSAGDASDDSANEKEEEDEPETSDSEPKKKSKAKAPKKTPPKAKAVKKEKPKKETKSVKRKKVDIVSDTSDDSEPDAKKSKLPDDEDIKQLVKTILEEANLHEITMKKVIKQVYDTYPDCDLTDKKSFIKKTIKTVLQLNEQGEDR